MSFTLRMSPKDLVAGIKEVVNEVETEAEL
jgi:hypothetical protein